MTQLLAKSYFSIHCQDHDFLFMISALVNYRFLFDIFITSFYKHQSLYQENRFCLQ